MRQSPVPFGALLFAALGVLAGGAQGAKCNRSLTGCAECTKNSSTCSLCRAGYRLLRAGTCVPCTANCLLCPTGAGVCSMCADGYYRTTTGRCALCQKGCAGKCAADGSCPGRCRPGYGKVGRNCRQCTKPNCENCDGSKGICRRCEALGYGLVGGACRLCAVENCDLCVDGNLKACQTCAFGFYLTPGRKCERCSAGCMEGECRPDGTCKQCKSKFGLVNGRCKACVLQDNFPDEQSCLRCDGNELKCTKCELHHGLMSPTYCQKCDTDVSDDTCDQCDGDIFKCSQCGATQFLMPNKLCKDCSAAMGNCAACTNATTCTQCWVGHTLVRGACVPCPRGCDECGGNPAICKRCSPFHVLARATGRCIPL